METKFRGPAIWLALMTVTAGIAAASAQALGGPPPDPGLGPNLTCIVPDVRGESLQEAKRDLVRAKCKKGLTTRAYSKKVKKGGVIDQVPGAGYHIRRGTEIDLTVSLGAKM